MTSVFLNGRFYTDAELNTSPDGTLADARVSAFDAGFQHAVGLFETMLGGSRDPSTTSSSTTTGWCFRLDDHLERLRRSAYELGLSDNLNLAALAEAVLQTIERSRLPRARVRLTITAGDLNLLVRAQSAASPRRHNDPTIMVVAQPATQYPSAMFDRGVSVVIADARANPLNSFESHKTLNYWWRLRALQAAASRGAAESLVLQVSNHLASGCVSNLFLVQDGVLKTPIARGEEPQTGGVPSPVLPGVTRAVIRELASARGVECRTEMLSLQELLDADEVFLTNSSWGILPVVSVVGLGDNRAIADGVPGKLTHDLRAEYLRELDLAALA